MARVDLKCACGYKFFVGDAQLKAGVECPSCGNALPVPGAAPAARKPAPPKPAAKSVPPPEPEAEDVEDFDSLPAAGPSKNKLYIIGGAVTVFVVAAVAVLLIILTRPKVDYDKQAELENQRRRKMFEDISTQPGGKSAALPWRGPH